jgi:GT2 family glycosyltransferase
MRPLRALRKAIRSILRLKDPPREEDADRIAPRYQEWISLYDTIDDEKRNSIRQAIKRMEGESSLPLISVVMPVYNPPLHILREALDSVINQLYPNWELCVADDASPNGEVRELLSEYAARDKRIKVCFREKNGHISEASNSALELAAGEFVAFLDHDDVLAANALYEVVSAVRKNPEALLFYSDEDVIDESGRRCDPYFKPEWDPDLIMGQNYFCHLGVYGGKLLKDVGGFRTGFEGSQDYDLLLRCLDAAGHGTVRHIPKILYHWRRMPGSVAYKGKDKSYAFTAAVRALKESLARNKTDAEVSEVAPYRGLYRVKYALTGVPKVSIVIPIRDKVKLLEKCVTSVRKLTDYPDYEILIVDNGSAEKKTGEYLRSLSGEQGVTVLRDDGPFNYSRLNNMAAAAAGGEVICMLNSDTEVITPGWLTEMTSHALRPRIGAVGARLWYADGSVQHAGVTLGYDGVAGHVHRAISRANPGYFGRAWLTQSFSAVTAACLVIKKSIYDEVGGFDERLTVLYNDVDFCLRIREAGYRNLWTPFAELYHYEAATKGYDKTPEQKARFRTEVEYMLAKYGDKLRRDPASNPNLEPDSLYFELAFPPRDVL